MEGDRGGCRHFSPLPDPLIKGEEFMDEASLLREGLVHKEALIVLVDRLQVHSCRVAPRLQQHRGLGQWGFPSIA